MSDAVTSARKRTFCCCGKSGTGCTRPKSSDGNEVGAVSLHSEPLHCHWLSEFLHKLLSPISNALSMLIITLSAVVLAGDLIAKLENFNSRGRQDTLRYMTGLLAKGNLTDADLMFKLRQWSTKNQWGTMQGTYYTYSLISTIGYGRYTTVSIAGRCVSAIFLILMVPIGVLYVQCLTCAYQSLLTHGLLRYRDRIEAHPHLKRLIFPSGDIEIVVVPITILTIVMQLHLLIAIPFLCLLERWNSMEALYYLTCSTTSVGFGDFHPAPHSFSFVIAIITFQFHLAAVYTLIINYLNDAFEWILQSYYSHGFDRRKSSEGSLPSMNDIS